MEEMEEARDHLEAFGLDWENPPTLKELQEDYTNGKVIADDFISKIESWLDIRNVTGKAAFKKTKTRSSITPRMVRKQNEWRYASLSEPYLTSSDLITAKPVTAEDVHRARQAEIILNHQFKNKIDRVQFIDEYVRTAVDEGTVLLRTGWESQYERVLREVPITEDPAEQQLLMAQGMPLTQQVEVEVPVINHPTVEVVPYTNFVIDPTCMGILEKANFVIVSFDTSLSDLKGEGINYQNLDILESKLEAARESADADHNADASGNDFEFKDPARRQITAYEYWGFWDIDGDGQVEPIVVTWANGVIIRMEENPFPDKEVPFVLVTYMPVRHEVYGEPDAALLEDNQKIMGATVRGAIDIMARSANGQRGMRKNALDPTNRRRFENGQDFEYQADANPNDVFFMHKFEEIPQSVLTMMQIQNNEAESISGIKAFNSGITGRSLGEQGVGIKSALDATSKREMAIQRRLANGVIKVCRKFMAMNAEWLSEEEIVRISNEEFVAVRRDDLQGEIDIDLQISTPEADNEKAQELAFMLQTTGPNSDPGEVRMIRAEIARLRNMPDLAKRIESYEPPPPSPEQIEMQRLEMAKMAADVAKIEADAREANARAMGLEAEIAMKQAKTESERAKALETKAKADKTDLDFVEQETGVTHERELEKERVKLEGQIKLKQMDLQRQSQTK